MTFHLQTFQNRRCAFPRAPRLHLASPACTIAPGVYSWTVPDTDITELPSLILRHPVVQSLQDRDHFRLCGSLRANLARLLGLLGVARWRCGFSLLGIGLWLLLARLEGFEHAGMPLAAERKHQSVSRIIEKRPDLSSQFRGQSREHIRLSLLVCLVLDVVSAISRRTWSSYNLLVYSSESCFERGCLELSTHPKKGLLALLCGVVILLETLFCLVAPAQWSEGCSAARRDLTRRATLTALWSLCFLSQWACWSVRNRVCMGEKFRRDCGNFVLSRSSLV